MRPRFESEQVPRGLFYPFSPDLHVYPSWWIDVLQRFRTQIFARCSVDRAADCCHERTNQLCKSSCISFRRNRSVDKSGETPRAITDRQQGSRRRDSLSPFLSNVLSLIQRLIEGFVETRSKDKGRVITRRKRRRIIVMWPLLEIPSLRSIWLRKSRRLSGYVIPSFVPRLKLNLKRKSYLSGGYR